MSNLPAKQSANTIQKLFENPKIKSRLQAAIPQHLTVDRLLRVAITAIRTNPKLMECTQESLLACVMGCATLGLEPEPFLGQAYMVPYYNKKKRCYEAQLIPGYRGYIALARRSGELQSLSAQCVYENDFFKLGFGLTETLEHVPAEGDRGGVKGAYCIFRYKDGSHSFDYMPKSEIDKIRERSKAGDSGPWKTDYPEMAKKTVIRRHIKVAPLSIELAKAGIAENLAMGGESQIDFFVGGNEPATVTEKALPTFDALAKAEGLSEEPALLEFMEETAAANDCTVDEVKAGAEIDFDGFVSAFGAWIKSKNKTETKDAKPPSNSGANARPPESYEEDTRNLTNARLDLKKLKAQDSKTFNEAANNLFQQKKIGTKSIDRMQKDDIAAIVREVNELVDMANDVAASEDY
jgi:recombination protein RecT